MIEFLQNKERFPCFYKLNQAVADDPIRIILVGTTILDCMIERYKENITTWQCAIEIECVIADAYQKAKLLIHSVTNIVHDTDGKVH